jgi:tRNA-modifying protein YgfZ
VLANRSHELAAVYIAGDAAPAQLTAIGLVELPQSPWANGSVQVAGAEVLAVRAPWTASVGWLLWVSTEALEAVWNALCGAGVRPVGSLALDAARIEHRFPLYGRDISDRNLPQEVSRDAQAISFVKGCYIGQETVARIDALGHVNRRLVSLCCDNPTPLAPGSPLTQAGQTVGEITSSASVPGLGRAVAMAYVRRGHDALGAKLDSEKGACEIVAA